MRLNLSNSYSIYGRQPLNTKRRIIANATKAERFTETPGGHPQPAATVVAGFPQWQCQEHKAEAFDFIIIDVAGLQVVLFN
jgi:hypothetical protein